MIKKTLICALMLMTGIVWAENPNLDYPTDTIEGVVIYRYPVEKSIGLYRVSVNFSVPQSTIIEWNPFLKERGLQFGDTLYIPTGRPIVTEPEAPAVVTPSVVVTPPVVVTPEVVTPEVVSTPEEDTAVQQTPISVIDTIAPIVAIDTITNDSTFKLALLLPLQAEIEQRSDGIDRFVDFYEGCLIALKDRQDSTQKIDLYVYDTGKELEEISRLMGNELSAMNAIIGPAYPQQVATLDTFVRNHQIPTMIPFTNDVDSLENNPFLYLFNTTSQMEMDTFLNYLEKRGELTNCVFVEGKEEDIHKDILYLRNEIIARQLPHTQTTLHDILEDTVSAALVEDIENIVLFNITKFANVQILLPHLISGKGDKRVSLFSQFAWQKERIVMPQVYTTIFATDSVPALADYETAYTTYFGHRHASLIPRYDLLGYDITRQFLDAIMGKQPTPGLQSDIRFTQVGEGGYINTHIMLMHK